MVKKCKCNIISFGHLNLYILLIPLGAVFSTVEEIIISKSKKLSHLDINKEQHPVILAINKAFGLCLSFIFFIIYKICNKKNKNTNVFLLEKMLNKIILNKNVSNIEKFLWILLGAVLDFSANILYSYCSIETDDYLTFWSTNIILMSLFSFLFLNMKLYKHHYLSIIFIMIIGIIYNWISGNFNADKLIKNYKSYIISFISESIFNILYVLYEYFMFKKFINLYAMLFCQGLIELILGIITLIITTNYYPEFDSYYTYIKDLDSLEIGLFFALIIAYFLEALTIYIIIYIFTPFHIFLVNVLSNFLCFFIIGELKYELPITITCSIFLIFYFFFILLFVEIIQLNFCGLSTMTKKNIEERALMESKQYINDINDTESQSNDKNDVEKTITYKGYAFELKYVRTTRLNKADTSSDYGSVDDNNNL